MRSLCVLVGLLLIGSYDEYCAEIINQAELDDPYHLFHDQLASHECEELVRWLRNLVEVESLDQQGRVADLPPTA